MANASGSNHDAAYVRETQYGVTPATPVMKPLRNTGVTLALTKDPIQSEELRKDRQIACFRHGNRQVGGNVNYELSISDFDDMLEAALCGTWTNDELKAGVTRRSFTIERFFSDIATRIRYTGCEVNTLSLTVAPNAVVSGVIGIVGKDQDPSNAMLAGATYPTPIGGCPFDSFSGVIKENDIAIGTVTQIEFNINNGITPNFVVGSKTTTDTSIDRSNVSGTMTAYFASMDLLNKFVNETPSSIEFELVNEAGDKLTFIFPTVKYNGGQPDVSGPGSITIALPFQALYNAGAQSQIVIVREMI